MKNITVEQHDLEVKAVRRARYKLEDTLTDFAVRWLKDNYNVSLTHDILINARLTRSMGRVSFMSYSGTLRIAKIEISEKIILDYRLTGDSSKMIGVLKHELIHYALFKLDLPFKDSDQYFKDECKKHNAPLSINGTMGLVHVYECMNGHVKTRDRKIDTKRYVCGCDSRLEYKGEQVKLA